MTGGNWQALLERASALRQAGRVPEAIAAYERLLAAKPDLPESWYNLAWLQRQARRFEAALASYDQALRHGVSGPEEVHVNRAVILSDHLGRASDAEAELNEALAIAPAYLPALLNLGNLAEDLGRKDEARSAYARALDVDPSNALALARLAGVAEARTADDPMIRSLREALERPDISQSDRADLGFALGRLLDGAGAFDAAFQAYADANAAMRADLPPGQAGYDRGGHEAFVDRLIATFAQPARSTDHGGATPLFICGMFRSGSTLAEQILGRHRAVTPGGELDLMPAIISRHVRPYPEAAASLDARQVRALRDLYRQELVRRGLDGMVTDKRPDNFLHIGLIKTLFPDARIVNTRRNALDNVLSLYFLQLDPSMTYALDLEDATDWYGQYRRLMAHWRALYPDDIFELDYDALVARPRPVLQALLDFCGLDWDEDCLDFAGSAAPVKTASVWQVRQPLYTRSSGRWRNYAHLIQPLQRALQQVDDDSNA